MEFNSPQRRVIVNADDFGWNDRVTDAILECFRKQWISQTTLLVNYAYAAKAVELAKAEGVDDRVGLHLNFTTGVPLTGMIRRFGVVCDADGNFKRHTFGNGIFPLKGRIVDAIRDEARAQIERYLNFGLPLMHCDGHHHVHNRLQFAYIVFPLLKEYGFRSVRNRYSIFTRPWIRAVRGRLPIGIYEALVRCYKLKTTSGFGGWEGGSLAKWYKFSSFELMVHPNYDSLGRNVNVIDFSNVSGPEMKGLGEVLNVI